MGHGVSQQEFLSGQTVVLSRVGQPGGVQLGHLEPEKVDLTGSGPLVPAEGAQLGVDLCHPSTGVGQRRQVDRTEPVQRIPLRRGTQQTLVGVLSVEVDEASGHLGEAGCRLQVPVHVGAAPTFDGHHAPEYVLPVAGTVTKDEPALHDGLGRPGPHDRRIGPSAQQQLDSPHDHGLAGTGLTGDRGEARTEHHLDLVDHPQSGDP